MQRRHWPRDRPFTSPGCVTAQGRNLNTAIFRTRPRLCEKLEVLMAPTKLPPHSNVNARMSKREYHRQHAESPNTVLSYHRKNSRRLFTQPRPKEDARVSPQSGRSDHAIGSAGTSLSSSRPALAMAARWRSSQERHSASSGLVTRLVTSETCIYTIVVFVCRRRGWRVGRHKCRSWSRLKAPTGHGPHRSVLLCICGQATSEH